MVHCLHSRLRHLCFALILGASTVVAVDLSSDLLEYIEAEFGTEATDRLKRWEHLSAVAASAPVERQLQLVNSFFNRVQFVDDIKHWGEEDYWATPVEMLATNGGDCEDFSISKYVTLKAMGVPDAQLRIMYVKALELNQAHMVLAWYPTPDAEPLILDNLINEIRPASERPDLEPVYSFNGEGLWLNKQRGPGKRIGTPERLSRWVDLNSRLIDSLR
ncbi:transglutaminase-like cysteine peptidase [Marinobacter salicampi]|uniref:transglutaminase-like cysteine peptidase n=1 Tax=Marinobacter salicampi TaxID=435907 RepID=UPI00140AE31D|nr:transglutaminase-like cysteine peptidase [Marinobacter salicampi]